MDLGTHENVSKNHQCVPEVDESASQSLLKIGFNATNKLPDVKAVHQLLRSSGYETPSFN